MKKILITICICLITIIFLLGFIERSPLNQVKSEADIVYSVNNIPGSLKTVGNLSKREQDIICAVSRGLVEINSDGEMIPSLAESVDIKDDGIEYVFKIRDDVYWSDGSKITPEDIMEFFREIIELEDEDSIRPLLNVFGAEDYRNGSGSFSSTVGMSATDNELIIRLNSKDDGFLKELTKPQYRVRKSVILWDDIIYNYTSIPYSGNYSIADIKSTEEIGLIRNSTTDTKYAKSIHIIKDEGEDLALASFEIGDRDIVLNPSQSQLSRLSKEGKLLSIPSTKSMYLEFNKNTIFSVDDRKELYRLITEALKGYESNNQSLINLADGSYFRDEDEDLLKLQSRNVMSSIAGETEIPDVVYLVCEESILNKELSDYLSEWFDENTDITLVCSLFRGDDEGGISYYDMALVSLNADYNEKNEFYEVISPYISEDMMSKVTISSTVEEEKEIVSQIEDSLFESYLVLPLIFYNDTIAVNNNIENVSLDGNGNLIFELIKK